MIDLIISGISNALFEVFGYDNYASRITQGLSPPCFFIQCMEPSIKKCISTCYRRKNHFVIQYFPESGYDTYEEYNSVGERMFECLEVINADGFFLRGTDMRFEIVDGVLHFFVDYNTFIRKEVQKEMMGSMQTDNRAKG